MRGAGRNFNLRRALIVAITIALFPLSATAAGLSPRSVQLGSSGAGVTTTNLASFTTATASVIQSIKFEYCTTASGSCTTPAGLVTTAATLTGQTGQVGFSIVNTANGAPYITRASGVTVGAGSALTYTLGSITNPSATNTSYYIRISTYTGNDGSTGPVDNGTVAVSTAQQINLTGVTPEILIFCVGITITTDCTTMTGSSVDFGDFSPQATSAGTSVMQASTNAANGYNITVNGTTLASGVNTIPALAIQTAPSVGTSQFGLNLRANTIPPEGADPSNPSGGTGTYSANYGTANQYRFVTGDVVANALAPTNATTYTSSYMVNIGGSQAAGVYTATMTYICTANF